MEGMDAVRAANPGQVPSVLANIRQKEQQGTYQSRTLPAVN
jgi:hypothetical protein